MQTSSQQMTGFGSAENKEQDEFDQMEMSEEEMEQGISEMVSLFRQMMANKTQ